MTELLDEVVLEVYNAALAELAPEEDHPLRTDVALVAHGGYGRRDVAPYSDVDLMILHSRQVYREVAPLAKRLLHDLFDVGLALGQSVRTPDDACRLAYKDATIFTSLVEVALARRQRATVRAVPQSLSLRGASDAGGGMSARFARSAARSADSSARRSTCWSRTSSARPAACAICSFSAGSASPAMARPSQTAWP